MIKEISNFVEKIDEKYYTEGLTPSDGLHIWIKLDDEGKELEGKAYRVKTVGKNKKYFDEKLRECSYPYELILLESYTGIIGTNKSLDPPAKKIHSSSPFVVWFKKKSLVNIPDLLDIYFNNTKKYYDNSYYKLIDRNQKYLSDNFLYLFNNRKQIFDDTKEVKSIFMCKYFQRSSRQLIRDIVC